MGSLPAPLGSHTDSPVTLVGHSWEEGTSVKELAHGMSVEYFLINN